MKAKEMMIISVIIIVLLVVIIIGVKMNDKKEEIDPQTPTVGAVEKNNTEEFVEVKTDGTKVNTSTKLSETKKVDGLEISNIRLTGNGNVSKLLADVKNPTSSVLGDFAIKITVLDKSGNELAVIGGYIDKVEAGKTVELNASATANIVNAYDFKVTKQ